MKVLIMFRYDGDNVKLNSAVALANDYELLNYVYEQIKSANRYDYSDAPVTYIAKKYYEFMRICAITVKVYYPKYRWSKAMGYYSAANPRVININGYKLTSIDLEQLVSLFYHESCHAWNASDDKYSVHHGIGGNANNPKGKEKSMMYSVNRYVYEYFNYKKPSVSYKLPWYKVLFNKLKWW